MIIYVETVSTNLWSGANTVTLDFVPTLDISNKECWLKVEQFFMNRTSTTTNAEVYNVVRCNLTQPMSQEFKGNVGIGNNSVVYIRNNQCNWPAPPILVYIPDGPQQLTFTFDTSLTQANSVKVGMLVSLVAASQ
jgi:hypothetical protein